MSDTDGWKGRQHPPPGSMGWLAAQLRTLQARIRALENSAPLRSASISAGDLTIKDGGNVVVQDGGNLHIQDGGDVVVEGGTFRAEHADGTPGAAFGPLWLDSDPDVIESVGLLVQADLADANRDVFRAKTVLASGSKEVYIGQADNDGEVDWFGVWSKDVDIRSTGQVEIGSAIGEVFIHTGQTSESANAYISNTTGYTARIGSSLRYKQDVEPLDLGALTADEIVDALQGYTWRDKAQVEADPDTTRRIPGHIAEYLHEAGLGIFVGYDDQDRPDSVTYDRVTGALAQALRTTRDEAAQLRDTVTAQGKAIATLTDRLDALEA
ncbi:hypothetical protein APR04_003808 [Promicromonospora umidemergens]|uniref:Peptidase S74 domain-containing protein n=1 Tax=Promicromonospora umidemergens TaxID=629679 RepID=A0ABP8XJG8_9MICO|nr:hypothetical protein [Promicromonospora umidemergens]MCP2284885.1 hypothetical protein [Promicromonospora umidemergens]